MAVLRPFRAVRPAPEVASKVAALPYDVMNRDEAKDMAAGNPYSFLHISRSEIDLADDIGPYEQIVYEKAVRNLKDMIKDGFLIQDNQPCYYIYRQVMEGRSQTGIVGCASIDEYLDNTIKKHEFTRAEKEKDRICHFDYCNANTEPVFLTYRSEKEIGDIVTEWTTRYNPVYDFKSEDGIAHIVWVIDQATTVHTLEALFLAVPNLYIADGHHRTASAVKVGQKRREQNPGFSGDEEFNYFMSVVFPDEELMIMDYNRVVKDLNGLTVGRFLAEVETRFHVEKWMGENPYKPEARHNFGMYLGGQWYKLVAKEEIVNEDDYLQRLDVNILQRNLLQPILGIENPRTDKRIDFVGGIRGLKELERRVNLDMQVAFALYPPSMDDLFSIADIGEVMPPKSTWFEPKLRSGLFLHLLS